jgi:hypothetical protein
MTARIWRGLTREADKDTYFQYLQKTGLKDYARIIGNRGVWVLRRVHGGRARVRADVALGLLRCHQSLCRTPI